ncbi:GGDEF domain-containing protein [Aminobacter anthyllidis]|uniref:GGDEF domain-containing protein n=1 Tax=Aminobacter anthyllidis TaxID=1035067 RepID=UPI0024548805|nr:GGDEF domain-containing protein [Aminobacter anthyllidis]MDH4987930.1 GGDEF domain-containing protein [Aminobacter anthyllidis]
MPASLKKLSPSAWLQLAGWTVFGTLGCVAVSLGVTLLLFRHASAEVLDLALIEATVVPVILAAPLFFYLTLKLRELAVVNHKLVVAASTDALTACLNRGAFSARVENVLAREIVRRRAMGALLVIDADHFKSVNDRFGHAEGDEALRMIVAAIQPCLRRDDMLGRLGGEEFAVFLPGASPVSAADIAERIRRSVAEAPFQPGGTSHMLTVSGGGAVFDRPVVFDELFRVADLHLYEAKGAGRNRVELAPMPPELTPGWYAPNLPN